ncbi:hypothetical protein FR274_22990 [Vibrio vulnificus]|nr:hypothetical protein [Vibrio vulnificus]
MKQLQYLCPICQTINNHEYDESFAKELMHSYPYKSPEIVECKSCHRQVFIQFIPVQTFSDGYKLDYNDIPICVTGDNRSRLESEVANSAKCLEESINHKKLRYEMESYFAECQNLKVEKELETIPKIETQSNTIKKENKRSQNDFNGCLLWIFSFGGGAWLLGKALEYNKDIVGYILMGAILLMIAIKTFSDGLGNGIVKIVLFTILMFILSIISADDSSICFYRVGCM